MKECFNTSIDEYKCGIAKVNPKNGSILQYHPYYSKETGGDLLYTVNLYSPCSIFACQKNIITTIDCDSLKEVKMMTLPTREWYKPSTMRYYIGKDGSITGLYAGYDYEKMIHLNEIISVDYDTSTFKTIMTFTPNCTIIEDFALGVNKEKLYIYCYANSIENYLMVILDLVNLKTETVYEVGVDMFRSFYYHDEKLWGYRNTQLHSFPSSYFGYLDIASREKVDVIHVPANGPVNGAGVVIWQRFSQNDYKYIAQLSGQNEKKAWVRMDMDIEFQEYYKALPDDLEYSFMEWVFE